MAARRNHSLRNCEEARDLGAIKLGIARRVDGELTGAHGNDGYQGAADRAHAGAVANHGYRQAGRGHRSDVKRRAV